MAAARRLARPVGAQRADRRAFSVALCLVDAPQPARCAGWASHGETHGQQCRGCCRACRVSTLRSAHQAAARLRGRRAACLPSRRRARLPGWSRVARRTRLECAHARGWRHWRCLAATADMSALFRTAHCVPNAGLQSGERGPTVRDSPQRAAADPHRPVRTSSASAARVCLVPTPPLPASAR
jgi:hypothetical protein